MGLGEIDNYCPVQMFKALAGELEEPTNSDLQHESAGELKVPMPAPNRLRLEPGDEVAPLHVCKHCGVVYWVGEGA